MDGSETYTIYSFESGTWKPEIDNQESDKLAELQDKVEVLTATINNKQ
jgi:hypothetical protein